MDFKKGLVCSLTDEQATFYESCEEFIEDSEQKLIVDRQKAFRSVQENEEETMGLSKFGIKNPISAGWTITLGSLLLTLIGIFIFNRISIWTLAFFVAGIVVLAKGYEKRKKEKPIQQDTLDGDL
jgi:hypothetical protein